MRALSPARRGAAALIVAACAVALTASAVLAQTTPQVSVNPNNGPAGSSTNLTLSNFDFLSQCNPQAPTEATCIYVKFEQGTRPAVTIAVASGSNSSAVRIPAPCTAPANTNCADPGAATIHAHSPNGQDARAGFTVARTPPATTSTTAGSTTTSSTTSSSTTSSSSSTTVTTVVVPSATTTNTIATKKSSSSHSDVPRYIAVALVVIAAAGTAAVDTPLRPMRPPPEAQGLSFPIACSEPSAPSAPPREACR